MDRDFFISLCLATHRVGNLLNGRVGTPIKLGANAVLQGLILVAEGSLSPTQKKGFAKDLLQELESLEKHFQVAKAQGSINPANFSILEREYARVKQFAQALLEIPWSHEQDTVHAKNPGQRKSLTGQGFLEEKGKSLRARKILGLLDAKGKAQVWELQKVLPQVTKRTLRRDLDTLVQKGLLERKGQWNTVFYQIR